MAMKRIRKDLEKITKEEENGILVDWDETNLYEVKAMMEGPEGTPWESGIF